MSTAPVQGGFEPELETTREIIPVDMGGQVRLTIDYELSRVPIQSVRAALEVPGLSDESLLADIDSDSGRRVFVQRAGGEPFPAGSSVRLSLQKYGDAPRRVLTLWTTEAPAESLVDAPEFVSAVDVFSARAADIEAEIEVALSQELGPEKTARLRFERFLADWDRETFTTENVVSTWTDLSAGRTPLGAEARTARLNAITLFTHSLFQRARRRGLGMKVRSYADLSAKEAGQLGLIAALHEELFELHIGSIATLDTAALGRLFIEFATCEYKRDVKVRQGIYMNGRPNGAVLVTLAEFAELLAERDGRRGLWHELHPAMVGCIGAYARSHGAGPTSKIGEYGLGSLLSGRRLGQDQISFLCGRVAEFARQGSLHDHWKHLLHLLAPLTFDQVRPSMTFGLGDYVDPPELRSEDVLDGELGTPEP